VLDEFFLKTSAAVIYKNSPGTAVDYPEYRLK